MRTEVIRFNSEGDFCAGTLTFPEAGRNDRAPAVVLGHGFATVRGMRNVPEVTRALAAAGIISLAIDYRSIGDSAGQPRHWVAPYRMRQDLRNALTWMSEHPRVDAERLGLWGTSFSGGQVIQVAAFDRRIKALVAQVPAVDIFRQLRGAPPSQLAILDRLVREERRRRLHGEPSPTIPVSAPDGVVSLLGSISLEWLTRAMQENPSLRNEVTVSSIEEVLEADPADYIEAVSPTPLLVIVADQDETVSTELTLKAYERAGNPKKLVRYEGGHYDIYDVPTVAEMGANAARDWFVTHLLSTG